jgi:hypothetical protein
MVVNSRYNNMETKSVSRTFTPYLDKIREIVYATKVDNNGTQFVQQTVYYRSTDGIKGVNVDIKV